MEPLASASAERGATSQAGDGPAGSDTVYLLRSDHPQVQVSWGSRLPAKPDKLKLRKYVDMWPIRFTLKADYDTASREFEYGLSCKDTVVGGRISVNMPEKQLEYRKKFGLPNGLRVSILGTCAVRDRALVPNMSVLLGYDTHGGSNSSHAVWAGDSFDVRQRFKVVKGLGVEVCGSVKMPAPQARYSAAVGSLTVGEGAFHLHVAEINAIIRI